jgi:hypothetical protein
MSERLHNTSGSEQRSGCHRSAFFAYALRISDGDALEDNPKTVRESCTDMEHTRAHACASYIGL